MPTCLIIVLCIILWYILGVFFSITNEVVINRIKLKTWIRENRYAPKDLTPFGVDWEDISTSLIIGLAGLVIPCITIALIIYYIFEIKFYYMKKKVYFIPKTSYRRNADGT